MSEADNYWKTNENVTGEEHKSSVTCARSTQFDFYRVDV